MMMDEEEGVYAYFSMWSMSLFMCMFECIFDSVYISLRYGATNNKQLDIR